jgi:type IV secretion system protein VirB10
MRLSRKALAALAAAAALIIGGAIVLALHAKPPAKADAQSDTAGPHATPDGLAAMPKDYAQVPKLGPPLPGDLGRPILNAETRGAGDGPAPSSGATPAAERSAADTARQQAAQTRAAARTSRLFARDSAGSPTTASGAGALSAAPLPAGLGAEAAATASPPAPATDATGQAAKRAFMAGGASTPTLASGRLNAPVSPYLVQAGTVIPAALITGLRSDLPGQITAQVTQNVYDSPTGRFLLIPQGTRLIGEYDSSVAFGQNRVLLAWTRLILPGGASIPLDREPGADAQGFAGLQDRVDQHWGQIARATLLSTLLAVGAETGSGNDSDLVRALRRGTEDTLSQTGQALVRRQLDVQPTLTIRPGYPVRVIVTRDLTLAPLPES